MPSPAGIGTSPLGGAAYAFGTPPPSGPQAGAPYQDVSGQQQSSPAISLALGTRGQYVYDANGRRVGQGTAKHQTTLALATERGSSCVPDLGHRFAELDKITDGVGEEMKQRVNEALNNSVARGVIRVDAIEPSPQRGQPSVVRVRVTDTSDNNPIDVNI